jgi:hypothetical protein
VNDRDRTVSRELALMYACCCTGVFSDSSTISHCEPDHAPWHPRARGSDLLAAADATRREDGSGGHGLDDLRPQDDRADVTAVAATLAALGDDDVDIGLRVLQGLVGRAAQRRDLAALGVDVVDHVLGRRAQGVGDERHLGVLQRDLDLGRGRGLGPAEELEGVVVLVLLEGDAVVDEQVAGEVDVTPRHHVLEHLGQILRRHVGVHALVLVGDDDVDAVGVVTDVLVDPVQLDLELLGREADGAEHAETTGLGHRDDDVTAVGEREDRELDPQFVADGSAHQLILCRGGRQRFATVGGCGRFRGR